jgi:hypothetical protein
MERFGQYDVTGLKDLDLGEVRDLFTPPNPEPWTLNPEP